jgi:3-phenylpropionate/trans-cinnamate dioxygenase ferredoxin component
MPEIASSIVTVAAIDELVSGERKFLLINGSKILLVRLDDGYYAIDDTCTHEEESLSDGAIDGCEIECSRHGARFDIKTGEVKSLPAVIPLRTYKVIINEKDVMIDLTPNS